ncbi:hypothetical protein [Intrasporangium calvum]|uniref:Uncharacterized protein n=1 Tax=Intrasporangium calvum (strain ATCC 23552 / DSM 43043 / JCM 3097 / NBRC 12989 / NCIMB 10167 / NRRL B-3866 / 7 KIP) TaxID=710696 RepID=E6S8L3_INTC7|nr:hypothetical protein [Intrasporangium calvum]ADU49175.1 hypothetical protein Intca_2673 [Intrasporangium calvum DSM 43043]
MNRRKREDADRLALEGLYLGDPSYCVGPERLPAGAYVVELILKCRRHPRTNMGGIARFTIPEGEPGHDMRTMVLGIAGTSYLPEQPNPEHPKLHFVCPDCKHHVLMSHEQAGRALDVIWQPWSRRVVSKRV